MIEIEEHSGRRPPGDREPDRQLHRRSFRHAGGWSTGERFRPGCRGFGFDGKAGEPQRARSRRDHRGGADPGRRLRSGRQVVHRQRASRAASASARASRLRLDRPARIQPGERVARLGRPAVRRSARSCPWPGRTRPAAFRCAAPEPGRAACRSRRRSRKELTAEGQAHCRRRPVADDRCPAPRLIPGRMPVRQMLGHRPARPRPPARQPPRSASAGCGGGRSPSPRLMMSSTAVSCPRRCRPDSGCP